MRHSSRRIAASCLALVVTGLLVVTGCGPGDPRTEVLKERSRWTAELTNWIAKDDGTIRVSVKFSGPPSTKLEKLTVRVDQFDASEQPLTQAWHTIDVADVPMGSSTELSFSVPSGGAVEGMTVAMVLSPTPEEEQHIVELQGL